MHRHLVENTELGIVVFEKKGQKSNLQGCIKEIEGILMLYTQRGEIKGEYEKCTGWV